MKLGREEVLHISRLSRVGITEAEIEKMREQLSVILENFEILREVDTDGIPPTAQSITLQNVMRDDVVTPSMQPDEVLDNAPRQEDEFFKVNAVLEEQNWA
jgi:aspartyl-tRNA(Asn)/glutamyl-tRNA(Gln) amidotransferase subunit C